MLHFSTKKQSYTICYHNHAHLIVITHACSRAATYGHIFEYMYILDLRKLNPK